MDIINEKINEEGRQKNQPVEEFKLQHACIGDFPDLKTIILWIYNINQNGAANTFREEMSQYFTSDANGGVMLRDMTTDMLEGLFASLSTAKEIKFPKLGVRIILLILNSNQNGVNNTAKIAYAADQSEYNVKNADLVVK